ncbi:MAG: 2Fe-2S iron-sulfur cluster binding domain-containing protein, partial [Deltaproteobacteria bacterium]|nr:2Fe-2S iron-sulfur cluster binding domain-containing protein [Deltaproteobacteria bacterium]
MERSMTIELKINGKSHSVAVSPGKTLLSLLREDLELKGTKEGCGTGDCGACIVIRDGETINSCITLALDCDGSEITTIERVADKNTGLHPLQESFVKHGAVQCGYCTPGMILAAKHLLDRNPHPTREEIKTAISGNLCRCTGYKKIVDAIDAVSQGQPISSTGYDGCIGKSFPRTDALEHVTGTSCFGTDVTRPGMVHGKILRSPHPHALIKRIDTSSAESLEGVLAVVTGKEVPRGYFGVDIKDRLVFAREKVRYRGEEVAAVAAVNEDIALKALELIRVDYEPLSHVLDAL